MSLCLGEEGDAPQEYGEGGCETHDLSGSAAAAVLVGSVGVLAVCFYSISIGYSLFCISVSFDKDIMNGPLRCIAFDTLIRTQDVPLFASFAPFARWDIGSGDRCGGKSDSMFFLASSLVERQKGLIFIYVGYNNVVCRYKCIYSNIKMEKESGSLERIVRKYLIMCIV